MNHMRTQGDTLTRSEKRRATDQANHDLIARDLSLAALIEESADELAHLPGMEKVARGIVLVIQGLNTADDYVRGGHDT
jgi:hypothetical protein